MRRSSWLLIFLLLFTATATQAQNLRSAKDYFKRGISRFSKGDLDGAITEYNKAIEADPLFAEAHLNRGKTRRAKGDLDGAINDYEKAIELDPRLARNNRDITQAYSNRGFIRSNPDGFGRARCSGSTCRSSLTRRSRFLPQRGAPAG